MSKLRVHNFAISLDGYGAGPNQGLDNPLGVGGLALHDWMIPTRTFRKMQGEDGGASDVDDDFVARGFDNIEAWISAVTCSDPSAAPGRMTTGRDGGATIPRTTLPSSCSRITPAPQSSWRAARPSTSSRKASMLHYSVRRRRLTVVMFASVVGPPRSGNTFEPS